VTDKTSRRDFFARSTMALGGTVGLGGSIATPAVHAFGSDCLRIGVIGCGARGRGATIEALQTADGASSPDGSPNSAGGVKLVAMADLLGNQLQTAFRTINGRFGDRVDVGNRRFVGIDAWRGVLASDLDLVILATPPAFRPAHFEAAVAAGKHVFMECPVATDMPGVRRVLDASGIARERGLAVAAGSQRRYEARTRDCVAKLQDGMIGDLVYARTYINATPPVRSNALANASKGNPSSLEFQLRNWKAFPWASGDFVDDRHLHSLDCLNWVLGQTPLSAHGFGGSQEDASGCTGVGTNRCLDHQLIELAYSNDFRAICQCRHSRDHSRQSGEHFHGTLGSCDLSRAMIRDRSGKVIWQSEAKEIPGKGWRRQFNELVADLREGRRPNDVERATAATTTAILGRMAVRSGNVVSWDDVQSCNETV